MDCCQCQGIESSFTQQYVAKQLARYRARGAIKTTRMLIEAIQSYSLAGLTLLDIGGGTGAVQHALVGAGVEKVTSVDASSAYIKAAREEAQRRHIAEQIRYHHGDFVELADTIEAADIVTLDRVICCYHDMYKLVDLSAARARKYYGLVYPRETWLAKLWVALVNCLSRLQRSPFRTFVHPGAAVEALIYAKGFKRLFYEQTFFWQVAVYGC